MKNKPVVESQKNDIEITVKRSTLRSWPIGMFFGVVAAGLLGLFYYHGFPSYITCELPAGFWLPCFIWAYVVFFGPYMIVGACIGPLIQYMSKRKS